MDPMLDFTHPELARRYELLVDYCWSRGWNIGITSSSRTEATQRAWYQLFRQGQWPNLVADPDRYYCVAPDVLGAWPAYGSMHMLQADGWSHALDLHWLGPTSDQFRAAAWECGLHAVEPTEDWHYQFWDVSRKLFPVYYKGNDDVTQEQFSQMMARALGRPGIGTGCTRVNPTDGITVEVMLSDNTWWSVAEDLEFTNRNTNPK